MIDKTFEMAKIFEKQGHYQEAYEIYSFLKKQKNNEKSAQEALDRINKILKQEKDNSSDDTSLTNSLDKKTEDVQHETSKKELGELFEKWFYLSIKKKRIDDYKLIRNHLK